MKRPRFISALLCFLLCSGALLSAPPAHPYLPANAVTYLAVFSPVLYAQAALPERVSLSVAPVFQLPELPNGCEGTSLTAVLRYFGYNTDKVDIALNYVPRAPIAQTLDGISGPDPYLAYSGNPTEEDFAYYCFAPPIVEAANRYLTEHGQPAAARDISGATQTMLMNCLCAGYPVVMWATLGFREPCQGNLKWTLTDNTLYTAYNNLHCFVLKGYDGENFSVADPLFGDLTVDYATLMQQYMAVGSHAAVLELHRAEAPWADSRRLV